MGLGLMERVGVLPGEKDEEPAEPNKLRPMSSHPPKTDRPASSRTRDAEAAVAGCKAVVQASEVGGSTTNKMR